MPVGQSGYPAGPHLHLEYRIPNSNMSSNWEAVDPRLYIAGGIIPGNQQTYTGIGSGYMPFTYKNLLLAGAKGMDIPQGSTTYASGGGSNSWNAMLRQLMSGQVPYRAQAGTPSYGQPNVLGASPDAYIQGSNPYDPYDPTDIRGG
jgi:hypothetical protein